MRGDSILVLAWLGSGVVASLTEESLTFDAPMAARYYFLVSSTHDETDFTLVVE